jgi:hypothetical protein
VALRDGRLPDNARVICALRQASRRTARPGAALLALCACALLAAGCSTGHPAPLAGQALQDAETFPYYPIYWVGHQFGAYSLTAADGLKGYSSGIGDSVYYGDCVREKGILGGGSCQLPLQVTTVIYRLHSNTTLGAQRNAVIRGVPAVIYDEGRSIELYSGRLAIDVFSDSLAHAMQAAQALRPLNAPGSASGPLPAPVFCPGLSGAMSVKLRATMARLPQHACQRAAAIEALTKSLTQ